MASVTIKGREEKLQIILSRDSSYEETVQELQNKLETMQRLSQSKGWEAFFSIPDHYDEMQLFNVISIVAQYQGMIAGFQSDQLLPPYDVHEGDIRSGEHITFLRPAVVFGNIHSDAHIIAYDDLFVMGHVEGNVILQCKSSALYIMSCRRANLQICDQIRLDVTEFSPKKFYYDADMQGDDRVWQK